MARLRENIFFGEKQCHRLLRWKDGGEFVEIVHSPERIVKIPAHGAHWHYHRALEMTLIQHGSTSCYVANELRTFLQGELFILGPEVPHYWNHPRNSGGLAVQWEFPPEHGIWDFLETQNLGLLQERAQHGLLVRGRTAALTGRQMEEMVHLSGMGRLCVFLKLLHDLTALPNPDIQQISDQPFDLSATYDHEGAIQRALSYIQANYRESINLSDLLDLTGMSRTTFTRLFSHYVGTSFSTHVNEVRLKAVCNDLGSTSKAVSYIAFDHGFTQLSFFNRLFRRELGISPSDYRAQHMATRLTRSLVAETDGRLKRGWRGAVPPGHKQNTPPSRPNQ